MCDFLKFYCIIVNFSKHKLAKSRNFRSLRHKKRSKLSDILSYFLTLTWLREGASAPLAPFLVAPLILMRYFVKKNCKKRLELAVSLPNPNGFLQLGVRPQSPATLSSNENSWLHHWTAV